MLVGLAVFAAGIGLIFVLSLFLQEGLHASPRDASLGLVPLTLGLIVALGDAKPDEAGSASGSLSSIQQLASAIGSAAVTSIFFQAATSGLVHAMKLTLIVVLAVTALSLPIVALMPRKASSEPQQ
jgi:cadmium resistance protein CadD (predicted permease)